MEASEHQEAHQLVTNLFRHQAAKIVASLTRMLGARYLDLAEDVVQDALVKALQQWPFNGIPENPAAWLTLVARNRALDLLRRDSSLELNVGTSRTNSNQLGVGKAGLPPLFAFGLPASSDKHRPAKIVLTCMFAKDTEPLGPYS